MTRRASMELVEEKERLEVLKREQLPRMRAVAEKWRNGTAISSVVLAVLTATGGSKRLDVLVDVARTWTLIVLAVLAVSVVVSLIAAMRASFGWPVRVKALKAGALRAWETKELITAYVCLRLSLISAAIAVVALFAATGLLLLAPHLPGK
ncbi:hypothetical protein [Frondihabitans sp. VKM Ac-2883]|uniref:hypothetical protein n=1 Tax=Frondihabitans sp. VKM Ac-2883 TaxID=2783823 RepID=UPI00188CB34C|nr:hypothetical protein [Frondihabitans sp. VKM Ac-2883]MBF4575181.1 hypothetical protein [Frondihabitans sp. VKM Ac-2883]